MKKSIMLVIVLLSLLLTSCSNKPAEPVSAPMPAITKNINLYTVNQIEITYATFDSLDNIATRPQNISYSIQNTDVIDALAVSLDNLKQAKEDPQNITYHARFYQGNMPPIDMWFGFPDKVWMKNFQGKLECWSTEGRFANLLASELPNVPLSFKGELGINGLTNEPVLFVFDKPYNLVLPQEMKQHVKKLIGGTVEAVGKPFIEKAEDYIEVISFQQLPSREIVGELQPWLDVKSMALITQEGNTLIIKVSEGQRNILKEYIGKKIKVIGSVGKGENLDTSKLEIYFYKLL